MRLDLHSLLILQEEVRDRKQIPPMVDYVFGGGRWTKEALQAYALRNGLRAGPQILITLLPDGVKMIHDGHHRCLATLLAGRKYLDENEYATLVLTYEQYKEINFKVPYITPFDPMTEVRVPDWSPFKVKALALAINSEDMARQYILAHRELYVRSRTISRLSEMAQKYKEGKKK